MAVENSLIRVLLNEVDGRRVHVAVGPGPNWDEEPSRLYMIVSDIENLYRLIYDEFEEGGYDEQVAQINAGANIVPYAELPSELQEAILVSLDSGKSLGTECLTQLVDYLK